MEGMPKVASAATLASVCVLVIIVLGAVQSTPLVGTVGVIPTFLRPFLGIHNQIRISTTTATSASTHSGSTTHFTTMSTISVTSSTESPPPRVAGVSLAALGAFSWYLLIPIVIGLGAGMVYILSKRNSPNIFDLKSIVKEMDDQRSYFVGSWSSKLRNAALLRYYILMAQSCAKVGIVDVPTDTPQEFIWKASSQLELDGSESFGFADAVDRAHYGVELTGEEVHEASRFMDAFTKSVAGRVPGG